MQRAQTSLPALAVALLVLTTTAALGLAMAEGAFGAAEREPDDRRVAVALSERLVSDAAALTVRANVLNASRVGNLTERRLRSRYPVVADRDVRLRLDDRVLVDAGSPTDGATVRRVVLVHRSQRRSYEPGFVGGNATTLPRRTDRARLTLDPPNDTVVRAVRANDRVVLRNASGLVGSFTVGLSRFETVRLTFEANRSLAAGDVRVTYVPARTTKAVLEVTVGD